MICVLCGSVLQSVLPGLVDQKEITAALRQCNYDPEEVISVYLTMFGEILLQTSPSGDHNYTDLNSFRSSTNSLFTHQQQAVCLKAESKVRIYGLNFSKLITRLLVSTLQSPPGAGPGHRRPEAEAPD